MRSVTAKEVAPIFAAHGVHAWWEVTRAFGRTFHYRGAIITSEPAHARTLLTTRAHTQRRAVAHKVARMLPGANGILFLDGEPWKLRMKALMPSFTADALSAQQPALEAAVGRAVAAIPAEGADLFEALSDAGLQVVLELGYNLDPAHPSARAFGGLLRAYKRLTMRDAPARRLDDFGVVPRGLGAGLPIAHLVWDMASLTRALDRAVAEVVAAAPWADAQRVGWVQLLIAAGLSGRALTNELNHLYGAFTAADYTATCLSSTLTADAWAALRSGGEAALEHALSEAYRRFPVTMALYRRLGAPEVLGGEEIPADKTVILLPYALHHDPAWWADPLTFRPARWEEGVGPLAEAAFEPFLTGPRRCIGKELAQRYLRALTSQLSTKALHVHAPLTLTTWEIPRPKALLPYTLS